MNRPIALVVLTLAACAGSPATTDVRREAAPDETARQKAIIEAEAKRRDFPSVLIRLDQAMESYSQALNGAGTQSADEKIQRLERLIRDTVLDQEFRKEGEVSLEVRSNNTFEQLCAASIDGSEPRRQGIALAALGFSGRDDVLDNIVQGAMLDDPYLVDRAVFGLAMLRAPGTPPGVLARVIENTEFPEETRNQAAWALYRLQDISRRVSEIVEIWQRYLGPLRESTPDGVQLQAVRGLGLTRDVKYAELVAPYLKSPFALIRMAAANALARMNAQDYAGALIEMLNPGETNTNVLLHVRKALQALAGDVDYGYDVEAWRKVFERR